LTRAAGAAGYRVDAGGTTAWIQTAGEYRIRVDERGGTTPDVRLLTIRGMAELSSGEERTVVRAGYEAGASATTSPSLPYAVAVSTADEFDRWWDDDRYERASVASSQYLPTEIAYYGGVLDRHGEWGYEPSHGYVWYPRVDVAWQPYSTGRWSFVGSYGWVWIGADRWSWPTHHYGRWGWSGRRYYWIPGRRWAPAWVSWTSAPGYVGWCPLGYDDRPLVSIHVGVSQGWRSWTYLPSRHFDTRIVVATGHRGRYLPPRDARFARDYRGPIRPVGVVTRAGSGLRGPSHAIPRGDVRARTITSDRSVRETGVGERSRAGSPFDRSPARTERSSTPTAPRESSPRGTALPRTTTRVAPPRTSDTPAARDQLNRPVAAETRQRWVPRPSTNVEDTRSTPTARPVTRSASPRGGVVREDSPRAGEEQRTRPTQTSPQRRPLATDAPSAFGRQAPRTSEGSGQRQGRPSSAERARTVSPAAPDPAPRSSSPRAARQESGRSAPAPAPPERVSPTRERGSAPARAPRVAPSRSSDAAASPNESSNGGGSGGARARARGR
jgi:hypothetical protein